MAFIQYLAFDGVALPMPDSYEVGMTDVEADSGGETEAGDYAEGCGAAWGCEYFREFFGEP